MVGRMRSACAARIGAKPPRPITRRIVEEVLAVIGGAPAEALHSVLAEVLGERHQDVGHDLVVERG